MYIIFFSSGGICVLVIDIMEFGFWVVGSLWIVIWSFVGFGVYYNNYYVIYYGIMYLFKIILKEKCLYMNRK